MPLRSTGLIAGLMLLTAVLAGCLGGGDDTAGPDAEEVEPKAAPGQPEARGANGDDDGPGHEGNLTPLTFANAPPNNRTLWRNDTVQPQESCLGGGCVTGAYEPHNLSLEGMLPAGVPAIVNATLWADDDPLDAATVWVNTSTAETYRRETRFPDGPPAHEEEVLIVPRADTSVEVLVNATSAAPPDGANYTLRVTVSSDPARIPGGVPVAVPVEADGTNLTVVGDSAEASRVVVWGPGDRRVATVDGLERDEREPIAGLEQGEHVLAVSPWSGGGRILASSNATGPLRALELEHELGEPVTPGPTGQAQWSFELDRAPYALGLYLEQDPPASASGAGQGNLSGPNGTVLDVVLRPTLSLGQSSRIADRGTTVPASEGLLPGSYDATVRFNGTANVQVGHLVVHFVR